VNYISNDPLIDGVTKVLVIGNSFSDDGVEYYLHDMARSVGKPLVIGNLFRGGAPLDFHLKNAMENNKIYSYRKTTVDGIKTNTDRTSILEALNSENWDYICFQQASITSGEWSTIEASLPSLFSYVQEHYPISTVKYLFHQTWAYAQNSTTKNFAAYNYDQNLMYSKIADVSKHVGNLIPLYKVIPSGTAIQNGRTSFIGDNFTREGYHLDLAYGRFTAASTWFEVLFGGIMDMNYKPAHLSDTDAYIAKEAAFLAVRKPFEISEVADFKKQNIDYVSFDEIKVNFGTDILVPGWTALLFERENSGRYGLLDKNNKMTSVNIVVCRSFDFRKGNSFKKTAFESGIPSQVANSYFESEITSENQNKPFLKLENLNPKSKYKIKLICTVDRDIGGIGVVMSGENKIQKSSFPYNNKYKELVFALVTPNNRGEIELSFNLLQGASSSTAVVNGLMLEKME
jgi:hypothetical protein